MFDSKLSQKFLLINRKVGLFTAISKQTIILRKNLVFMSFVHMSASDLAVK